MYFHLSVPPVVSCRTLNLHISPLLLTFLLDSLSPFSFQDHGLILCSVGPTTLFLLFSGLFVCFFLASTFTTYLYGIPVDSHMS